MVIRVSSAESHSCKGRFLLTQNYWQVTVWVDKKWLRLPPSYQIIKDDSLVRKQNLVTIFLSDCLSQVKDKCVNQDGLKACFEAFCRCCIFKLLTCSEKINFFHFCLSKWLVINSKTFFYLHLLVGLGHLKDYSDQHFTAYSYLHLDCVQSWNQALWIVSHSLLVDLLAW